MESKDTIELEGTAEEVGGKLGKVLGKFLTRKDNISIQRERLKKFTAIIEEIAPWWLEEASAIARVSGVKLEKLLMRNCLPLKPNKYYPGNCTSFLIMTDRSKKNCPFLLKIRDEKPSHQIAGIKEIRGTYRYIFGTNVGNLGIAHFLNEKGLAGANNTGSPISSGANDLGLNDCHVLRLVAEKAKDCQETLKIIQEIVEKGYCGSGGFQRGMIFLFADIGGEGLLIENSSQNITYRFVSKGVHLRTNHFLLPEIKSIANRGRNSEISMKSSRIRYKRGKQLLKETKKLEAKDLFRFSRDTANAPFSLCNGSNSFPWRTLSAFVHELNPANLCSWVCNGLPLDKPYFLLRTG